MVGDFIHHREDRGEGVAGGVGYSSGLPIRPPQIKAGASIVPAQMRARQALSKALFHNRAAHKVSTRKDIGRRLHMKPDRRIAQRRVIGSRLKPALCHNVQIFADAMDAAQLRFQVPVKKGVNREKTAQPVRPDLLAHIAPRHGRAHHMLFAGVVQVARGAV